MNKYVKYGLEFVVFMIIFTVVDTKKGEEINWLVNVIFSIIVIVAQWMMEKRRKNLY